MRQSHLFTKTRKEAPSDETSKNAKLLIQGGFIHKEMAGVYSFLPLGLRTLNNIVQIIREEMNAIGGQEMVMTALQDKALWEKTDRWDDEKVDNWFKTTLKNGTEVGLSITHEEPLTEIMKEYVSSYRDLPKLVYQFQTKFRNELRAKSGIMRGREFLMKDLYSFCHSTEDHVRIYESVRDAYTKIFDRVGIGHLTYITQAGGGIFVKYSEEFQTLSDAGEDTIFVYEDIKEAINKEVFSEELLSELVRFRGEPVERKAIEVGNIFALGTRFSESLGLTFKDEDGQSKPVIMGSYGIGPSRLMGVIVETLSDEKGIVWPKEVAPFRVHLMSVGKDTAVVEGSEKLYKTLIEKGIEVLFDDRDVSAGEKFSDTDLIGIPYRVVVSASTLGEGKVEVKERTSNEARLISEEELFSLVQ